MSNKAGTSSDYLGCGVALLLLIVSPIVGLATIIAEIFEWFFSTPDGLVCFFASSFVLIVAVWSVSGKPRPPQRIRDFSNSELPHSRVRYLWIARIRNFVCNCLMASVILGQYPVFVVTGILGAGLKILLITRLRAVLSYPSDEVSAKQYENLLCSWDNIWNSQKIWEITNRSTQRWKTNGGASSGAQRREIRTASLPRYIVTNVNPLGIKLYRQKLFFMPDGILQLMTNDIRYYAYQDVAINVSSIQFVESGKIPTDAKLVGQTWHNVNRDGSRDKRFKYNWLENICEYGEVLIESGETLHVQLLCSDVNVIKCLEKRPSCNQKARTHLQSMESPVERVKRDSLSPLSNSDRRMS